MHEFIEGRVPVLGVVHVVNGYLEAAGFKRWSNVTRCDEIYTNGRQVFHVDQSPTCVTCIACIALGVR